MQHVFFSSLSFSISVMLPILLMLALGLFFRKSLLIDDKFCEKATNLVFKITLPTLLFLNIFKNPIENIAKQWTSVAVCLVGTLTLFILAQLFAVKFIPEKREWGTFVQGVYRSNNGILGLALCLNAYGSIAFMPAAIYTSVSVLLYNLLGVITLTYSLSDGKINLYQMVKNVLKNPLIIGIILGIIASVLDLELPKLVLTTANYLANITLPLALICTGASIDLRNLVKTSHVSLLASIGRVVIAPIFMVFLGKAFGLSKVDLGIVFLMTATPLAAATYAMVRAMGGNEVTVANIIGLTTFGSMFGSAIGIITLRTVGWI